MTTGPRLIDLDRGLVPGLIAVALFGIMTAVFLTADGTGLFEWVYTDPAGFPDTSIVGAIGYALIGAAEHGVEATENFLVPLILIAVLLDAALDGALMLAKRDDGGESQ
jgi:NADH-quinone oxidoreductase subunit J